MDQFLVLSGADGGSPVEPLNRHWSGVGLKGDPVSDILQSLFSPGALPVLPTEIL